MIRFWNERGQTSLSLIAMAFVAMAGFFGSWAGALIVSVVLSLIAMYLEDREILK